MEINEKFLILLGFCADRNGPSLTRTVKQFTAYLLILLATISCGFIPSIKFILDNIKNLSEYVLAIAQVFACFTILISLITFSIYKDKVRKVTDDLDEIVKKCK